MITSGLNGTFSPSGLIADPAVGAAGGALLCYVVPYAFKNYVSNGVEGMLGEGLTQLDLALSGQTLVQRNAANGVGKSTFDFLLGEGSFVESKFGTGGLSSAQRRAAALLGDYLRLVTAIRELRRLQGSKAGQVAVGSNPMNSATTKEDHSVQIHLKLRGGQHGSREERDAIHVISNQISTAVDLANAGELDGDQFGDGEGVLYLYGPDADQLWSVVFPVLKSWELNEGSYAVKRFGPPGSRTETVTF